MCTDPRKPGPANANHRTAWGRAMATAQQTTRLQARRVLSVPTARRNVVGCQGAAGLPGAALGTTTQPHRGAWRPFPSWPGPGSAQGSLSCWCRALSSDTGRTTLRAHHGGSCISHPPRGHPRHKPAPRVRHRVHPVVTVQHGASQLTVRRCQDHVPSPPRARGPGCDRTRVR